MKRDSLDEFVDGVVKKSERNNYAIVGEMDDMSRGRFNLESWDDVEAVFKDVREQRENLMDDLPKYYIVGGRPVKMVKTENRGLGVYALSFMTGEFVLAMRYLAEVSKIDRDDVEQVSEDKFNEYVEKLRVQLSEEKKSQEDNSNTTP